MLLRERPSSIVRCVSGEPSCPGVAIAESRRRRGLTNPVFSYRLVPEHRPACQESARNQQQDDTYRLRGNTGSCHIEVVPKRAGHLKDAAVSLLYFNLSPVPSMQVRSFSSPSTSPLARLQLARLSCRTSRCRSGPHFRAYGCAPTSPYVRVML